jgi:hypothetical protein
MADQTPQGTQPAPEARPASQPTGSETIHIAEELEDLEKESRSRTIIVVGAVLLVIAVAIAVISFATRPKPKASGTIDGAYAVALPGDNVLTTVRVSFNNIGGKPLWVRDIKAQLTTPDGKQYTDVAASAIDFDRYFRGYPDLRDHSIQPLKVETKVLPGEQVRGSVIVSFPVPLDTFNNRKSLSVLIYPYASAMTPTGSEPPVTITKEGH